MAINHLPIDARDLLRRYEPLLRLNARENYTPLRVEPFLARASLYQIDSFWRMRCVRAAPLTLADLQAGTAPARGLYFLRFVPDEAMALPPSPRYDYEWDRAPYPPTFQRTLERFAGAILFGRAFHGVLKWLWDLLGSLPSGAVAAAYHRVREIPPAERSPTYYGRILADGTRVILQYWFFYPVNDWRSNTLGLGLNDHEGDWEHVDVVLERVGADLLPIYVTASAHYESGQTRARKWERVEKQDTHPIIYVGNGSHANYFERGAVPVAEFQVGMGQRLGTDRRSVSTLGQWIVAKWLARFREGLQRQLVAMATGQRVIAFVDVAQGDGDTVGPGGTMEWAEPVVLDEIYGIDQWGPVRTFCGLWGRYVGDWTGRENGPAGPAFTCSRLFPIPKLSPDRPAFVNPLEWAGIESTPSRV